MKIGSSLASSIGQWVKMPENRLRILVACGAGGAIAATFNAPITTVFFGVEILLREFSIDALFTAMLSAMIADATAIPLLGSKPFLSGFPSGITLHHVRNYLLVAALAVIAALFGLASKTILYKIEDLCDRVWGSRPEWARAPLTSLASVVEMTGDFTPDPACHAGGRHRLHRLPLAQLRHDLHHQAAAPRHRHRPVHPLARPCRTSRSPTRFSHSSRPSR